MKTLARVLALFVLVLLFAFLIVGYTPLGEPRIAFAQADPCAGTPTNADLKDNEPFGVGFCLPLKDSKGLDVSPTAMKVSIDGAQKYDGPVARVGTTVTTINGVPHGYFVTPNTAIAPIAAGNHTASGTWSDGTGRSGQLTSFPFVVSASPGNLGDAVRGRTIK